MRYKIVVIDCFKSYHGIFEANGIAEAIRLVRHSDKLSDYFNFYVSSIREKNGKYIVGLFDPQSVPWSEIIDAADCYDSLEILAVSNGVAIYLTEEQEPELNVLTSVSQ